MERQLLNAEECGYLYGFDKLQAKPVVVSVQSELYESLTCHRAYLMSNIYLLCFHSGFHNSVILLDETIHKHIIKAVSYTHLDVYKRQQVTQLLCYANKLISLCLLDSKYLDSTFFSSKSD